MRLPFLILALLAMVASAPFLSAEEELASPTLDPALVEVEGMVAEGGAASSVEVASVPEPSRAVLLVAGIGFVLVAYRSAWVNFRNKSRH